MHHVALLVLLGLSSALGGCASPIVAKVAPSLSTAPRPYFVRIAEGLTSPTMRESMRVAPRMFSAYQIAEACQMPRRIDRLEAPVRTVSLQVGEALPLSTLHVVAISDANVAVPDVPIAIEAEELNPPIIQLRSDDPDLAQGRVKAIGSGRFRIRVRTLCSATNVEMVITGIVAP